MTIRRKSKKKVTQMEKPCDAKKEEQQKKRDKKVHSPSMTNYKTLKRSSTTPQA